jgi:NAD(P)H-dependent FMN reductase
MIKVGFIIGSTRPGRVAEAGARWVFENAKKRSGAHFEIVDVKSFNLTLSPPP